MLSILLIAALSVFWNNETIHDIGMFLEKNIYIVGEKEHVPIVENKQPQEEKKKYYYSNIITNPETSVKYFIRRDKGEDKCLIQDQPSLIQTGCELSPGQNDRIGICNQDFYVNDPEECSLMKMNPNGTTEMIIEDLSSLYENTDFNKDTSEYMSGAELLTFLPDGNIAMYFGYDFQDKHKGVIAILDLKTGILIGPIIAFVGEDNGDYSIFKNGKELKYVTSDEENMKTKGKIAIIVDHDEGTLQELEISSEKEKIPGDALIEMDVRKNFKDHFLDSAVEFSINGTSYTFDLSKEPFN